MMMDTLVKRIAQTQNPTVWGADTRVEHIPAEFAGSEANLSQAGAAQAILKYNKALVDALCEVVPAIKVQIAYYEMLGVAGMNAFFETCAYAKSKGMVVMADAKRNDIGATSEAYAAAFLGSSGDAGFPADFLTVNPYLGSDGILPFVKACRENDKGIFVLVKTSNPSSGEIQDQPLANGRLVYQHVAGLVEEWGKDLIGEEGYSAVGAVVGATHPREGVELRAMLARVFFLVPGYGAQGATGKDLAGVFHAGARGAIVNASRSLLTAWQKQPGVDFQEAALREAKRMQEDIMGNVG